MAFVFRADRLKSSPEESSPEETDSFLELEEIYK
jgi:hypothetical protein